MTRDELLALAERMVGYARQIIAWRDCALASLADDALACSAVLRAQAVTMEEERDG